MATCHVEQQVPSSPSYEPPEDTGVGVNLQQPSKMDLEPAPAETRISETQSRAERLLALRAPLIERGKRVPALERSIARHEEEAHCLFDLMSTARQAEKVLAHRLDEARREVDYERLETDMVRERLREAEKQLAQVRDLSHITETAHSEEVALLKKRCAGMKRKIELLATGQRKDFEERIRQAEHISNEYRTDILQRTQERDQWRESAIASEEQVKVLKAKKAKIHSLSALLNTERTLSASLRKQLEESQEAAKNAEQQKAKLIAPDSGKAKTEKSLEAEKAKTTELRQKVKDADANVRKTQHETTKLRLKCEDLQKQLKDALERAVHAEERAADFETRPATRSRGLASPCGDMLMSPAPLQFARRPAEDMASESRSRFTATLPLGLQDEGSPHGDDLEGLTTSPLEGDVTPRSKRKTSKPQKLAPPRKSLPKRPASSKGTTEPRSPPGPEMKKRRRPVARNQLIDLSEGSDRSPTGPETKKRRRPVARKELIDLSESDKTLTGPATPSDEPPAASLTPRRKHGKATRKTTASSPAKNRDRQLKDTGSTEAPRRMLRSRRPISYNYDEQGRDIVNTQDKFEVDFEALRPVPVRQTRETRSSKSKKSDAASVVSDQHATRKGLEAPAVAKRVRRGQTIRKQVPGSRSRAK